MRKLSLSTLVLLAFLAAPGAADAQNPPAAQTDRNLPPGILTVTVCGAQLAEDPDGPEGPLPPTNPPAGTTFFWQIELCFPTQGGVSSVETDTYLYYMKLADRV